MVDIFISFETEEAEQKIDELQQEASTAFSSITANIRRTAEVAIFFAEASGVAIDQVLQLYISAGLRVLEFTSKLGTALTASTLGFTTGFQLAAQAVAIALMFAQINAITRQKTETARRIGLATSGLRALTF